MQGMVETRRVPSFLTQEKLRLILFGGKGGVGKTTMALASALKMAGLWPSKKILLLSTDPAHSLKDGLDGCPLPPNLEIKELNPFDSIQDFRKRYITPTANILEQANLLDTEDVPFFSELLPPGHSEILGLLEIEKELSEGNYDLLLVDTAPTGHTLRLLSMPDELEKWLELLETVMEKQHYIANTLVGRYVETDEDRFLEDLSGKLGRLNSLLHDRECFDFVTVMLPETLSLEETKRLLGFLAQEKIPCRNLIVNQVVLPHPCIRCRALHLEQQKVLQEIEKHFPDYIVTKIPTLGNELKGEELNILAELIGRGEEETFSIKEELAGARHAVPLLLQEEPLSLPENLRLLIFAGKGGVGKTTLSAATALYMAEKYPEKRLLLFSLDPAHSLSDALDQAIGPSGCYILSNLFAQEVDFVKEYQRLREEQLTEVEDFLEDTRDRGIDFTYDTEILRNAMKLSPTGVDEIMALIKLLEPQVEKGYDCIILDGAPTGHFLQFLQLPEAMEGWLKILSNLLLRYRGILALSQLETFIINLSRGLKRIKKLFRSPGECLVVPVTIPTEMALEETRRLLENLREMTIPYQFLILNKFHPQGYCSNCSAINNAQRVLLPSFLQLPVDGLAIVHQENGELRGPQSLLKLGRKLYESNKLYEPNKKGNPYEVSRRTPCLM
ncbi:MAG: TRC40/GET3/ArsA family transport-energizing ATPase [Candidatus Brocadiaceae bacterium]|nr:TRC40/GET3/ArsA family transport-energizing ATPase [Candidatus Brocadiaceae bacterium]